MLSSNSCFLNGHVASLMTINYFLALVSFAYRYTLIQIQLKRKELYSKRIITFESFSLSPLSCHILYFIFSHITQQRPHGSYFLQVQGSNSSLKKGLRDFWIILKNKTTVTPWIRISSHNPMRELFFLKFWCTAIAKLKVQYGYYCSKSIYVFFFVYKAVKVMDSITSPYPTVGVGGPII